MKQFIPFILFLVLVSCRNQTLAPGPNEQQGAQGPQGVPGPQGEQGPPGPANSSGTIRAAGTCLNGLGPIWSERQSLFGGASCDNYKGFFNSSTECPSTGNFSTVVCPAGSIKIVMSSLNNCGYGGESAICINP